MSLWDEKQQGFRVGDFVFTTDGKDMPRKRLRQITEIFFSDFYQETLYVCPTVEALKFRPGTTWGLSFTRFGIRFASKDEIKNYVEVT